MAFAPVSACVHFELEPPSFLEMVEETYEKLDLLLFNADQQTLHDFSGHCGINTGPTDRINRRQLLKQIRDFLGASLDSNTDASNLQNLHAWIRFFRRGLVNTGHVDDESELLRDSHISRTGIVDQEPGSSGILFDRPDNQETGKGIRKQGTPAFHLHQQQEDVSERIVDIQQQFKSLLESQLQEIQVALQGIEGGPGRRTSNAEPQARPTTYPKWTHTVPPHGSQGGGKGWMPTVSQNVPTGWTPIEHPSASSLFRREFKIYGQINDQGRGDQLSFVSLSRQIEGAIEKGYSDMEIVEAVIKAMKPGMQLRSYLETVRDLTLPRLRQILMSHYKEKSGTQLYQELATIYQGQKETPEAFLLRCLDLRQKILFASQEADASLRYDPTLVQGMFLRSLETGLRDDNILAKLRPFLQKDSISDEELIRQMNVVSSAEAERQARIGKKSNAMQVKTVVVEETKCKESSQGKGQKPSGGEETSLYATVEAMKVQIKSLQEQLVETRNTTRRPTSQQEEASRGENYRRWTKGQRQEIGGTYRACRKCIDNGRELLCRHCNYCMGDNHFARDCLKRQADRRQGQGNEKGLRQWDKA